MRKPRSKTLRCCSGRGRHCYWPHVAGRHPTGLSMLLKGQSHQHRHTHRNRPFAFYLQPGGPHRTQATLSSVVFPRTPGLTVLLLAFADSGAVLVEEARATQYRSSADSLLPLRVPKSLITGSQTKMRKTGSGHTWVGTRNSTSWGLWFHHLHYH